MTSSDVETVSVSRPTGSVTAETTAMTEVMKLIVVSINLVHCHGQNVFGFWVPFQMMSLVMWLFAVSINLVRCQTLIAFHSPYAKCCF